MNLPEIKALDHMHCWHPYTDAVSYEAGPYTCIERAEGVYLHTADGRKLYDGIASWWAVALGHSHPRVVAAIQAQAAVLQHHVFAMQANAPAVQLAARLAALAPGDLNYCYFASDGSSAVEAALKMAAQYWIFQGKPEKTRFVGLRDAYHGDTIGAMGVGFTSWFEVPYGALVTQALIAPSPFAPCDSGDPEEECAADEAFAEMERIVRAHHEELAAVVVEPLCLGSAGIRIYPASYLCKLRELCDAHDVLLIADEVAVGFGRTGRMFACNVADIVPDILCLGKALTAGHLPMSAAIATERVFNAFRRPDETPRVFYDGHTFCGNPITSAAALAALDVMEELNLVEHCGPRYAQLSEGMKRIGKLPSVAYQKSLGLIGMCAISEAAGGAVKARAIVARASERGLYIRPLGEVLYLWPPLTATEEELGAMIGILETAIAES
jgi:adenosylmethionine-8-amino-7-oxononanoate aminotransferase